MNRYLDQIEKSASLMSAARGAANRVRSAAKPYSTASLNADAQTVERMKKSYRGMPKNTPLSNKYKDRIDSMSQNLSRRAKTRQLGEVGLVSGGISGGVSAGVNARNSGDRKNS